MFGKTTKNSESIRKDMPAGPASSARAEISPGEDHRMRSCSYIGPTLHIKGELTIDESLSIEGEVEGSIKSTGSKLTVGKHGRVAADIHAGLVEVRGKLEGSVDGAGTVHLYSTAVVDAKIRCGRMVMDDGAAFNGGVDMPKEDKAPSKGKLTLATVNEDGPTITR